MSLFGIFRKKKAPKNMLDHLQALGKPLIIDGYRKIASSTSAAPTSKTSDQKIIEIYQLVGSAFKEASKKRDEHLPAGYINTIVFKFFQVYEMAGETILYDHLKYEVNKYIQEGLRQDYKKDLNLF